MTADATNTPDPALVETASGGPHEADLMFIFGTPHWTPAEVAVDLFHAGLAPTIVATGGVSKHLPGVCEADLHSSLMIARGVPQERIICENESSNTHENVRLAKPHLEAIGDIRTVLAVVKWFHRRALIYLAEQIPTIERIYTADYEPFNRITRRGLSRANWPETCPKSLHRETDYLVSMRKDGRDLLQRTTTGWLRADAEPSG